MTPTLNRSLLVVTLLTTPLLPALASTADGATGVWLDHTGRGAVEVSLCGADLCGRLVWLKDEKDSKGCGLQIIGGVKRVTGGKWDGGWIYDPDDGSKYSVEITPMGTEKLKVMGYSGSKLFSETMIWTRAPADLQRCDAATAALPSQPKVAVPQTMSPTDGPARQPADHVEAGNQSTSSSPAQSPTGTSHPAGTKRDRDCKLEIASFRITFPCS